MTQSNNRNRIESVTIENNFNTTKFQNLYIIFLFTKFDDELTPTDGYIIKKYAPRTVP